MTRVACVLLLVLTALAMASPSAADLTCQSIHKAEGVRGQIQLVWVEVCSDEPSDATDVDQASPPRDSDWDSVCVRTALALAQDARDYCDLPIGSPPAAEPTPGLIARAFQRLPLPAATLVIQPPNGRTLVNFKTNFYTDQGEFTRTVTLLGRQVELRIWPASFEWRFGDGGADQTTSPGAAYPDLEITHEYLEKGRVSPSVDTVYAAQFRVGGGPWRDVAGRVTIPGRPQALRVVEARPVLVGG